MAAPTVSPLARKLRLTPGARAAVVGGPPGYLAALDPPAGTTVIATLAGPLDWIQVFVETSAELAAIVPDLVKTLDPNGMAWISFPKGASKRQRDLTRDKGWEPVEASNLRWLTLVSIDATWSAFSLRPYKPGEPRRTVR